MKIIMWLRKVLGIDKYDYCFCKGCTHYMQEHNRMVCMMCIEGTEFINKCERIKVLDKIGVKISAIYYHLLLILLMVLYIGSVIFGIWYLCYGF